MGTVLDTLTCNPSQGNMCTLHDMVIDRLSTNDATRLSKCTLDLTAEIMHACKIPIFQNKDLI